MSGFKKSLENGIHQKLSRLSGTWQGMTKTWFEPGQLADESPMRGTIRPLLDGRFLIHEYNGTMSGKPFEGLAIMGYDLGNEKYQCAWVDSFHMSTGILFSTGQSDSDVFKVTGSYGNPSMPENWGWRTEVELLSPDELRITAYNISPAGQAAKATETVYRRVWERST